MRIRQSVTPINYHNKGTSIGTVTEIKDLRFRCTDALEFCSHYKEWFGIAFTSTYHAFKALTTKDS